MNQCIKTTAESDTRIKTMDGWTKAADASEDPYNFSWDKYAKPGDLVDEGVYENFLNILPPRSMGYGYLQMGEPYSSRMNPKTGRYESTYLTFCKVEKGIYRYCGHCFAGQEEHIE